MNTVGAYEAKTRLPELLRRVARGEHITITRHGAPVARLVPASHFGEAATPEVVAEIRRFRKGRSLGGMKVRDLIREGRRY